MTTYFRVVPAIKPFEGQAVRGIHQLWALLLQSYRDALAMTRAVWRIRW